MYPENKDPNHALFEGIAPNPYVKQAVNYACYLNTPIIANSLVEHNETNAKSISLEDRYDAINKLLTDNMLFSLPTTYSQYLRHIEISINKTRNSQEPNPLLLEQYNRALNIIENIKNLPAEIQYGQNCMLFVKVAYDVHNMATQSNKPNKLTQKDLEYLKTLSKKNWHVWNILKGLAYLALTLVGIALIVSLLVLTKGLAIVPLFALKGSIAVKVTFAAGAIAACIEFFTTPVTATKTILTYRDTYKHREAGNNMLSMTTFFEQKPSSGNTTTPDPTISPSSPPSLGTT